MVKVEEVRDNNNKIVEYIYDIKIPKKKHLKGSMSREDVEKIVSLYCRNGQRMTMRQVARHFPQFTMDQFKIICKALGITKESLPIAPHEIEELDVDTAAQKIVQKKELEIEKKAEALSIANMENTIRRLTLEKYNLEQALMSQSHILDGFDFEQVRTLCTEPTSYTAGKASLAIFLSDMHIGAWVSGKGVYENTYSRDIVVSRLHTVLSTINKLSSQFDELIVFNLGDAIDGINNSTTRPEHSHFLPQNMTNREMIRTYIEVMVWFFNRLKEYPNVRFVSVCESNHGGDTEYGATIALSEILKAMGIKSHIAETPIDFVTIKSVPVVYLHGKDTRNQYKPFPNIIDDRTETFMNEWLVKHKLLYTRPIVIKGDQHTSALSLGKMFDYKAVGSLFGSSDWSMANFGYRDWAVDYSLFYDDGQRLDGRIEERRN